MSEGLHGSSDALHLVKGGGGGGREGEGGGREEGVNKV